MFKNFFISMLVLAFLGFGKPQAAIFFSVENLELNEFVASKNACHIVKMNRPVYYYIYSKKPFDTDYLKIYFVHLDNKGVIFAKPEIVQTLNVDVVPGDYAIKGKMTFHKEGQIIARVFSPKNLKKPLVEAEVLTEL